MDYGAAFALIQRSAMRVRHLIVLWVAVVWAAPGPNQLIQKVQKRYNHAHTLAVHFTETYSLGGHRRPPESGTLVLKKKGKMRWDYTQPEGKVFVSDGKNVFLYTPADKRVEKVPLKDTEDMRAPFAFLLGHLDMKKEFTHFETHPGEGGTWLDAEAKSKRVPYKHIEMLVAADGEIRDLNIAGRDGSLLSFSFSQEKLNPPVSNSTFHFAIPPGAQVVNSLEYSQRGR
ncbi:MAG: LolA family protein [Bryobacteraceae bacterium]